MSALRLYSPVNFVIGLQVVLAQRARLDLPQALAEVEREHPRWPYRLGASMLTGLLLCYLVFSALPRTAAPAMDTLARSVSSKQAALGTALVVGGAALWLAATLLRRAWRGYARLCRLGYAARLAR